jgi:hypothetical protein
MTEQEELNLFNGNFERKYNTKTVECWQEMQVIFNFKRGKKYKEIAEKTHLSAGVVARILNAHGLKRKPKRPKKEISFENKNHNLMKKYFKPTSI